MDHRLWDDLAKLTNDRSVLRGWKAKFEGLYRQLSSCIELRAILYFLEGNRFMKEWVDRSETKGFI